MKKYKNYIITGAILLATLIFTILVKFVDVKNVGANNSAIGLCAFNTWFNKIGYNDTLYKVSKYIGFIPFVFVLLYGILGLYELIKNKSFKALDAKIYMLLIAYILMALVYIIFEIVVINYRPVLEDGKLAASYPSSHTLFAVVLCSTSIIFNIHLYNKDEIIKDKKLLFITNIVIGLIGAVIVITRMFSGVHWITDIIGGLLFGFSIVSIFYTLCNIKKEDN